MPEYIGQDGLIRHVPRRARKRARPLRPALALILATVGLVAPFGLILALTYLCLVLLLLDTSPTV